jgi:hypothetical protein
MPSDAKFSESPPPSCWNCLALNGNRNFEYFFRNIMLRRGGTVIRNDKLDAKVGKILMPSKQA